MDGRSTGVKGGKLLGFTRGARYTQGMPYRNPEKQAQYQLKWMLTRRAAWLAANGPCVRCGSSDALEVDHIARETKVSHRVWSWKGERREEELKKCQVLCWRCHKVKTSAERRALAGSNLPDHGNRNRYATFGCRCDLCRAAQREYMRARRGSKLTAAR